MAANPQIIDDALWHKPGFTESLLKKVRRKRTSIVENYVDEAREQDEYLARSHGRHRHKPKGLTSESRFATLSLPMGTNPTINRQEKQMKITWHNGYIETFSGDSPAVQIKDECQTYCASVPEGYTVQDVVDEFARTYDWNGVEEGTVSQCSYATFDRTAGQWVERLDDDGTFTMES